MSKGDGERSKTEEALNHVTNKQPMARRVSGQSDSFLFKKLFQYTDTEVFDDDTEEIKQSKMAKRLSRFMSIKEGINQPFFRILEQSMLDAYYKISLVDIWEALKENKHDRVQELLVEQQSYMRLFELFKDISVHIETAREELESGIQPDISEDLDNPVPKS